MPIFDGESETFELLENLFQTSLNIHNQLTDEDRKHYVHSLMRGDALQTFKKISSPSREFGRNPDYVPSKIRKTSVNVYGKTQISTISFQSSEPEMR